MKKSFLLVLNNFFLSLPVENRNHNKYSLKNFVDSEFEIGETLMNSLENNQTLVKDEKISPSKFEWCFLAIAFSNEDKSNHWAVFIRPSIYEWHTYESHRVH